MDSYGKELVLDIHNCKLDNIHSGKKFTRKMLKDFFEILCMEIDMEKEKLAFWDYFWHPFKYKTAPTHLKGISAVQFIKTSNITIHALDDMKRIYINIFSCKDFNDYNAASFCEAYFCGEIVKKETVERI